MKSWKQPTNEMIDRTLSLVEKGTGRRYFFSRLKNPLWIQPLVDRGCFQSPPRIRHFDDGYVQFPPWPELQYLKNVSRDVPEKVANLVLELPKVDNPSVYDGILEIALRLHGEQSAKLLPKILESLEIEHQLKMCQYAELLSHWTKENQVESALELSKILVAFAPDPESKVKHNRRRENPSDLGKAWETLLEPSPKFDPWKYKRIMSKGVRPLAEREPYQAACMLIRATVNMIRFRIHQDDLEKEIDFSEAWCERLFGSEGDNVDSKKALVHTLTYACEQVYEKSPDAVDGLDAGLRNQPWKIFERLRQHLYAQNPSEQTKPWIRELILNHREYHLWEHRYEFQQMIRSACEYFRESLLSKEERDQIFNAIRSGPSRENHQAWLKLVGEEFTEDGFRRRQRHFHRLQLKSFAPVLFDEYESYLQELEDETNASISDEDYPPHKTRSGIVSSRSPRPPEDLSKLTDEALLAYINECEEEKSLYEGNHLIEVNIEGLSVAFRTIFREQIFPDSKRLRFWMENREKIERSIYVRMMITEMQADVKEKHFNNLREWIGFCEWVLSHPDDTNKVEFDRHSDESRENPQWSNSRWAVADFVGVCLRKDVNVPLHSRKNLAKLLEILITQFDWRLDEALNQYDPTTDNVNSPRIKALMELVSLGLWLRRNDSSSNASEVTNILEKRLALKTQLPLTLPEYAIIGSNYNRIFYLNETWATEHKSNFFPKDELPKWLAAFIRFVAYNSPFKPTFNILRGDFDFALQHLADRKKQDYSRNEWIDILGQHLFAYYLSGMYPLKGPGQENDRYSLLEKFYQATDHNREHWANLFYYVGDIPWRTEQLDKGTKDKILAFFDWRIEVKEPIELQQFNLWLEAESLDAEWRLAACSRILDVCTAQGVSTPIPVDALCKMLPIHTAMVVNCFTKLTEVCGDDNIYIYTEEAKTILKAGLASPEQDVHENAKRAHDNLLRAGRFDLLDLND